MNDRSVTVSTRGNRPRIPAPEGHYGCPSCGVVKPLSEFYKTDKLPRGHHSRCRTCQQATRRVYKSPWNEDKFWSRVDRDQVGVGCWIWTGPQHENGYGLFGFDGRTRLTHRIALMIAGVEVPEGMVVDHLCRVRLCCNPLHLDVVTQRENLRRSMSKLAAFAAQTECKHGHPFTPENIAHRLNTSGRTRHGHKRQTPGRERICLTCTPSAWRYALIRRERPPRAKPGEWLGPQWIEEKTFG